MWRRLPTTIALGGLLAVAGLYAALWTIALSGGHLRGVSAHFSQPAEFRSNHGPWRHHVVLDGLYEYALLVTVWGLSPLAWLGTLVERTRRAYNVAGLAAALLVVGCAHVPLFD